MQVYITNLKTPADNKGIIGGNGTKIMMECLPITISYSVVKYGIQAKPNYIRVVQLLA